MDEVAVSPQNSGRRERILPRLGFDAGTARSQSGASLAVAVTLTVFFLGGVAVAADGSMHWGTSAADPHAHESERLVYLTVPSPSPDAPTPTDPSGASRARDPERDPAQANPTGAARPPVDSVAGTRSDARPSPSEAGASREFPVGRPAVGLPPPSRLGEAIGGAVGTARSRSDCAAPCRDAGVAGYAPGTELARRDSLIRERTQDVVDRAGPAQKPPGFQVGLPGGGPTREERQRDSTLHADYRKRLQALLARYDSLKADSIARGMIKEPPPPS